MAALIVDGRRVPDGWTWLREPVEDPTALPAGDRIVALASWLAHGERLRALRGRTGVWLAVDEEPEALAGALGGLALVALHFPTAADGRPLSSAVLLRTRLGWTGELRALGDVRRDQLVYLHRCGFDSYLLPPDEDPRGALDTLSVLHAGPGRHYQPDVRSREAALATRSRQAV
jgi:uncharacterized protein (DUF934 family)